MKTWKHLPIHQPFIVKRRKWLPVSPILYIYNKTNCNMMFFRLRHLTFQFNCKTSFPRREKNYQTSLKWTFGYARLFTVPTKFIMSVIYRDTDNSYGQLAFTSLLFNTHLLSGMLAAFVSKYCSQSFTTLHTHADQCHAWVHPQANKQLPDSFASFHVTWTDHFSKQSGIFSTLHYFGCLTQSARDNGRLASWTPPLCPLAWNSPG